VETQQSLSDPYSVAGFGIQLILKKGHRLASLCLSKIRKDLNCQELYFLRALHSLSFDAYFSARKS
jgi:hypothetical protein